MSPGWASVAVFQDQETCMTALKAGKENRQMLEEFGVVTVSKRGLTGLTGYRRLLYFFHLIYPEHPVYPV